MNALVGLATPRNVGGVHESFGPTLTATLAAGSQLPHEVTVGVYISATRRGVNSYDEGPDAGPIAGSDLLLLTTGLAGMLAASSEAVEDAEHAVPGISKTHPGPLPRTRTRHGHRGQPVGHEVVALT